MTGIKGKYEFKTEKEGGPVLATDVLRESIGLDLSNRLGETSYTEPEEVKLLSRYNKKNVLIKNNLKYAAGHNILGGLQKYLHKEAPSYLRSAEFPNYVQAFIEGKISFYRADKLRNKEVVNLVSKYVPVENEIKEAFDRTSLNNKGLKVLDYFVDKLSLEIMDSAEFTPEDVKINLSPEEFRKNLNSLRISSGTKKAIFNSILSQIKYDNTVNKAFAEALKDSKGDDRKQLKGYFKYHNPYFLENQTMDDLSKLAKDYFDNFILEKDF